MTRMHVTEMHPQPVRYSQINTYTQTHTQTHTETNTHGSANVSYSHISPIVKYVKYVWLKDL